MSWPAVAWALSQRAPSSPSKFVLVMLADSASAGDWLAWPSVAYLSDATMQDRKSVICNLQKLEAAGLIAKAGKTGRTGQITVWRLPVVALGALCKGPKNGTVAREESVPFFPEKSPVFPGKESQISRERVPKTGHGTSHEPVMNPKGTNQRARASALPAPEDVPDQVWQDWLRHRASKKATVTTTVIEVARGEAKKAGLTFGEFLAEWCARGTQGLKAEWIKPNGQPAGASPAQSRQAATEASNAAVGARLKAKLASPRTFDHVDYTEGLTDARA